MSTSEQLFIDVRVRPRSKPGWARDANGGLTLGVAAAPTDGAATEEARRSVARALGVPPSQVALHRGARARQKVFVASDIDVATARIVIEHLGRST